MSESKDNSGAIFRNAEKKSERSPDYGGKAVIGGVEYRISGWIKQNPRGNFLSLAFSEIEEGGQAQPGRKPAPPRPEDDLPF